MPESLFPTLPPGIDPRFLLGDPRLLSNPAFRGLAFPPAASMPETGSRTTLPEYARSLRPAIAGGLGSIPLASTLSRAAARVGSMRGLDPGLADAVSLAPALANIQDAWNLAQELGQSRTDIAIYRAGGTPDVKGPGRAETALSGAAQGAGIGSQVGGPYGAAIGAGVGAVAGLLSGGKKAKGTEDEVRARAAQAMGLTEPGAVQGTLAELAPATREQVLASGQGTAAESALQAALSRSGLRDSALGSLASIAAEGLPERMSQLETLRTGLGQTRSRIEEIIGAPVRAPQPERDRMTEALGALADGFLTFKTLFPGKEKFGPQPVRGSSISRGLLPTDPRNTQGVYD